MRSKQSWAIRIVVLDWGDIQKIFWYLLTSKCNTNIVNWWGGESRGKLKMDIGGACPVGKHSKTDKNRVQTTWSWKSKGGRNLPGDGSSGEKHSGWSFSGGSICPCSHQVRCFIIFSDLVLGGFDFVKPSLARLANVLKSSGGPWLLGDSISLADLALGPVLYHASITLAEWHPGALQKVKNL